MDVFDFLMIVFFLVVLVGVAVINPAFIPCAAIIGGFILVLLIAGAICSVWANIIIKKEEEKEALKIELKQYIDKEIKENNKEADN